MLGARTLDEDQRKEAIGQDRQHFVYSMHGIARKLDDRHDREDRRGQIGGAVVIEIA